MMIPTTRKECAAICDQIYDLLEAVKAGLPDEADELADIDYLKNSVYELGENIKDWQSLEDIHAERKAFESWLRQQVM